jgi:hypothetical protein
MAERSGDRHRCASTSLMGLRSLAPRGPINGKQLPFAGQSGTSYSRKALPNITLQPTALIGKHFAKTKSKMLTTEARR